MNRPAVASPSNGPPATHAGSWRPASRTHWSALSPTLATVLVVLLAVAAFANTFGHGFVWDDTILLDQKVRFYRGWLDAWREPPGLPNMRMYRPLEMWSLWIERQLWAGSTGFHVTQVLLHALNGALLLRLALVLGATPWTALAGAALFVVHPAQVESVAWITCRADVMTATFALVAMLAFLRHQDGPRWWTVPTIAGAAFLATAAKETGSVTPLLLGAALAVVPRPLAPFTDRLRRAWPALVAALAGVVACQLLRPAAVTTGIGSSSFGLASVVDMMGAFTYHLARVLAPVGFAPYVPKVPTGPGYLLLAVVGAAGLLALFFSHGPNAATRRLGVAWFGLAIAPAVAVVLADFTATPVAERRLYLGMAGIGLVFTAALATHLAGIRRRATAGTTVLMLTVLFAVTVQRNTHWRDELTLWTAVAERLQTEPTPYMNLGLALVDAGRIPDAETAYRRALALRPRDTTRQRLAVNLGLLLADQGKLDEAEALFTDANALGEHAIAYRGLATVARKRGQAALRAGDRATANTELNAALTALKRSLAINPRYQQAYFTLGGVLYDAGQYQNALTQYRQAAALGTDTAAGRQAAAAAAELAAWLATQAGR